MVGRGGAWLVVVVVVVVVVVQGIPPTNYTTLALDS